MRLHHIGYVVKSIATYEKHLLFKDKIAEVLDPLQNARLALYATWSDTLIELIEPHNESSFTYPFLAKHGNAYHHLCYEVDHIDEMEKIASSKQLLLFKGPLQAPLFEGRPVYFFFDRNRAITEFLISS